MNIKETQDWKSTTLYYNFKKGKQKLLQTHTN